MDPQIKFRRHAKRRMKWRLISEEEVSLAFESPDKIEESSKNRLNVYKSLGQRYIKVTYRKFSNEILIISVVDKA